METENVLEIADRLKRISIRIKNSGETGLYRKGLRMASLAKNSREPKEALAIEKEYLELLRKKFIPKISIGGITTQQVINMSGYEEAADKLQTALDSALDKNPDNCSGSTADVATTMGITDLSGKNANQQVDYMANNWKEVDGETAQNMANKGEFVVAGLANQDGHGHTAVVAPGDGATKPDGNFYPNVQGGASSPAGKSDGDKTAGDIWSKKDRQDVKYYIPKKE